MVLNKRVKGAINNETKRSGKENEEDNTFFPK